MTVPTWVKATLLLAMTMGAGVVTGVVYERNRATEHRAGMDHLLDRLTHQLNLDSAQRASVAAILARRQGAVDSTWHALQPHVRATLDSTLREIVDVLRPDQAATYRKMVESMHPGALR